MSHRLSSRLSIVRTRWSAIGAAVAITLGAGGLLTASAADTGSVFIPITPTRVLDTRIPAGLSGPLVNSTPSLLDVTGTIAIVNPDQTVGSALVVPDGATSIVANVTGVSPTSIGFVSVRPGDASGQPTTSSLNFTTPGVVVPNSVTVAIPTSGANAGQLNLFYFGLAPGATTHLLIDIVGYYTPGGGGTPGATGPEGPPGPSGATGPQGPAGQPNTGHSRNTFDDGGTNGIDTSTAISTDGNPIISYHDFSGAELEVIACTNPTCTGPQAPVVLDTTGITGIESSITIGKNGNPIISYTDASTGFLKLVACTNPTCVPPSLAPVTLDNTGIARFTSITIGTNGNPIISYHDVNTSDLKLMACTNPTCALPQPAPVTLDDAAAAVGLFTSITIGTNGNPIIGYYNTTNQDLKLVACTNPTCALPQPAPVTLDGATTEVGQYLSITIGTNGNPIISYHDETNGDLKVMACTNVDCSGTQTPFTMDSTGSIGSLGRFTSIVIGTNGNPFISYFDATVGDLRVLACGNPTCQNYSGNSR